MIKKRIKPHLKPITVDRLLPSEVEYFCKTRVIDEIILKKEGKLFDPELADALESKVRFYFVVKKNMQYDVVSGELFEPWLEENNIGELFKSEKAKACVDHYVRSLT